MTDDPGASPHSHFRVALVATGGTIEKTYDHLSGVLHNRVRVLDLMLAQLELRGVDVEAFALMNKDSLDMTEADHDAIAHEARARAETHDGVVVIHGTDRLAVSGDRVCAGGPVAAPIVFTGAMRPYELRTTDALQNVTEALLAVQLLAPGVYCVFHNRVLPFPGVVKDPVAGTFRHRTGRRPPKSQPPPPA